MAASAAATITMSMREIDRLKTVQAVVDCMLRVGLAAERLGLSRRQVERLVQRYQRDGAAGLVSGLRGRPSNHQLPAGLAEQALTIIRQRYADFGPTLAREKLMELHGLWLGVETVRRLMTATGLWVPRNRRMAPVHQPRARRSCLGELVQIDGSDHAWFEDRGPMCTLLVFIDDATSRLMQLHFVPTETTFGYFEAMRRYLLRHGKPVALYSDKASIFKPVRDSAVFGPGVTQFGRALFELNIDGLCANTSQAKGRVERANLTLQDRLVKELRLRGISTPAAANAFTTEFMEDFNARFGKPPRQAFNAHRPLRPDEDLDAIFTWRVQRKVTKNLTLQYDQEIYLLPDTSENRALEHRYIEVWEYPDQRVEVRAEGRLIPCERYDRMPQIDATAVVEHKRLDRALQLAQLMQIQRDIGGRGNLPSRTSSGEPVKPSHAKPGTKHLRQFTDDEFTSAVRLVGTLHAETPDPITLPFVSARKSRRKSLASNTT